MNLTRWQHILVMVALLATVNLLTRADKCGAGRAEQTPILPPAPGTPLDQLRGIVAQVIVADEHGLPVPGLTVRISDTSFQYSETHTDANGVALFASLGNGGSGDWSVSISGPAIRTISTAISPGKLANNPNQYRFTVYPLGKPSPSPSPSPVASASIQLSPTAVATLVPTSGGGGGGVVATPAPTPTPGTTVHGGHEVGGGTWQ